MTTTPSEKIDDDPPPKPKYKLVVEITGNSHEELATEIQYLNNGGYLLDSDHYTRDEFNVIGGRITVRQTLVDPDQTPENYKEELDLWFNRRKNRRKD